ncbi:MAG: hypothetical protein HXX08_12515 [Chloroflexi bacterium]|uniref:M20/M25/M40 family metallo-hydrolase n=1 Tax=Candidatus Chlorohelix allophototropha TaxID=3003348 RepID=A0A8T7M3Q6_9CHLR|nr:hypothetical protein [Chloroflexota bacterium]WJW66065.1 hypothetical protein OZ401_001848 [Chloroflexota bacterium L227-S17]
MDSAYEEFCLNTLRDLVSIPTASFFENNILAYIEAFLKQYSIPYTVDRWGNILAHYSKGENIRPLALMAHTDHPAFEITAANAPESLPTANLTALLLGGVNPLCFEGAPQVKIYSLDSSQPFVAGKIVGYKAEALPPRKVELYIHTEIELPEGYKFGIWDLLDFQISDDFIYARVIDDLVGCASALLTLHKVATDDAEVNLYGVFTRAEEVGLVGADMVFQSGALPLDTLVVSIEASKALPGAIQGEGPVIRTGDRFSTFDSEAEFVLNRAALKMGCDLVARAPQPVKIQRQLMTGGRCEASSAILNGYKATGLAFPLGNYHNVSDDSPGKPYLATENIHVQDYLTGVKLLQQAALLMVDLPTMRAEYIAKEKPDFSLAARLEEFL